MRRCQFLITSFGSLGLLLGLSTGFAFAEEGENINTVLKAHEKPVPENLEDLLEIEKKVAAVVQKVTPVTVGVRIGRAQGSGVIVSKDGYVLTAAHVSGGPGKSVDIILHDGRRLKGKTLGLNTSIDAGLIQITDKGDWPYAEMGDLESVDLGDWVVSTGHPGGYRTGRPPVVRLGRMLLKRKTVLQSGCTLVGGDSGGPLFDLDGKVIGIHSRIGSTTAWNFHVPISAYQSDWKRLVASEAWGSRQFSQPQPTSAIIGVRGEKHPKGCRVTVVSPDMPAAKAGIQEGDIITKFDGRSVDGFEGLYQLVGRKKPGDKVIVEFYHGDVLKKQELILVKRPS